MGSPGLAPVIAAAVSARQLHGKMEAQQGVPYA